MARNSKETHFNDSWGKDAGFNKQIDRGAPDKSEEQKGISHPIAHQILSSYQVGSTSDTRAHWMSNLTRQALSFIANQRGIRLRAVERESQRYHSTRTVIEQLFDLLQLYAYDFNQSAVWTSLQVTCTRPAFVTEVLRFNKLREPVETITTFRARLSTRFLSLVIVGGKDSIEFRLLPVEEVIGLSRAEAAYEPFLIIESRIEDGEIKWQMCDDDLTPSGMESMCMELFSILIEQTKVEAAKNQSC